MLREALREAKKVRAMKELKMKRLKKTSIDGYESIFLVESSFML
jgi:hypothetical protein